MRSIGDAGGGHTRSRATHPSSGVRNPSTFASLLTWHRADLGFVGGGTATWANQGGAAGAGGNADNNAGASPGPTLIASDALLNHQASLNFNASGFLRTTLFGNLLTGGQTCSVFFVIYETASQGVGNALFSYSGLALRFRQGPDRLDLFDNTSGTVLASTTVSVNAPISVCCVIGSAGLPNDTTMYVGGTLVGTGSNVRTASYGQEIMSSSLAVFAASPMAGVLAEVAVTGADASANGDRAAWFAYTASRYGV